MALVVVMVIVAFGLLYMAVVTEERHLQQSTRTRKK
jgi:hypothetical protein